MAKKIHARILGGKRGNQASAVRCCVFPAPTALGQPHVSAPPDPGQHLLGRPAPCKLKDGTCSCLNQTGAGSSFNWLGGGSGLRWSWPGTSRWVRPGLRWGLQGGQGKAWNARAPQCNRGEKAFRNAIGDPGAPFSIKSGKPWKQLCLSSPALP